MEDIKKIMKELKWKGKYDVTKSEHKEVLQALLQRGYILVNDNEYQSVLTAPKQFNWTGFIFFWFAYLVYYAFKKSGKQVTLNKISRS